MGCSACGADNPPGARFCNGCGAPLGVACASCGHGNPAASRFCNECGHALTAPARCSEPVQERASVPLERHLPRHLAQKILASRAGLEGEHKQVTVLFADVAGSTELIRDLDAEDAQRLLDGAVSRMTEAVHRFEGTVSRAMGDGIMALFGAPLAHEDHAVRACYAALAMHEAIRRYAEEARREHGVEVAVRVGLNSGEVVVRLISDDLHMDYTALGQTVHLASRMEQLARGGTTGLTAETLGLVEGYVQVKGLGPIPIKGLPEPIEAYELVGTGALRTRLEVTAARGLTRFVGRQAELDALQGALERARAGLGQLVALVGEAGVGKSRLVWEVTHSHRTEGWTILESGSVAYGKATPYLPVVDLLKRYCRIEPQDDARSVREKVLGKLLHLDRSLEPMLPALLWLLDVSVDPSADSGQAPSSAQDSGATESPLGSGQAAWEKLDPAQRRHQTLDAVRRLLLRECQEHPLLLVFDDLHWIDAETQAVLDGLVESLPTARILLLVNYRPDYAHAWGNRGHYTQLRIDPLGQESARELLRSLLGEDPSVQPLAPMLIERTHGNPFFLEESVRTLVEEEALLGEPGGYRLVGDVADIRVPPTVQAILAARIDRLPPEHKRLLQTAAVVGKDVPLALLQAIAGLGRDELLWGLGQLQLAEFLYEASLFPEPAYTFKHALTHEVAYRSLLQKRRRALHAAIVDAIEALAADPLSQTEPLAQHALRGEVWAKAVSYLRQAGANAMARSAYPAAVACFEQALTALPHLEATRERLEQAIDLHFDLRNALMPLGEPARILRYLREAEALARTLDDPRRLGWLSVYMSHALWQLGRPAEARGFGQRSLPIAATLGELPLQVAAHYFVGHACYASGDYRGAEVVLRRLLRMLPDELSRERFGLLESPAVLGRAFLACALAERGAFDEAVAWGQEAVRLAEVIDQPYSLIYACWALAQVSSLKGDLGDAVRLLERSVALGREWKITLQLAVMTGFLGGVHARSGRVEAGMALLRQALAAIESMGWRTFYSRLVAHLGEACLLADRTEEALTHAERALTLARQGGQRGFEAYALRLLGEAAARRESTQAEQAQDHCRDALALAAELGMRPLQAHCHLGLGKLRRQMDRRDEARAELSAAVEMFRDMGMAFWLPDAEAELTGVATAPASAEQVG